MNIILSNVDLFSIALIRSSIGEHFLCVYLFLSDLHSMVLNSMKVENYTQYNLCIYIQRSKSQCNISSNYTRNTNKITAKYSKIRYIRCWDLQRFDVKNVPSSQDMHISIGNFQLKLFTTFITISTYYYLCVIRKYILPKINNLSVTNNN